ncbi:MAG: ImmA/IrrE family metallo-endopeptidase [Planctomycetaceae bacterium]|nr:ImmA/IrrE family metallo-endopeptidase [Planctomycetaceae bacterium]
MGRRNSAPKSDVPFLHAKQIEREADLLLEEYALKFPTMTAPPMPVDGIAELHLQLSLEYLDMKSLFPMADVHGAIWFQQARIGIDQSLDPDANPSRRGRYHFTLAHEVGHWRLHRQHFVSNPAQRTLFGDGTPHPDVVCRSSEVSQPVEWQANAFASCLLMPRKLVHSAWTEFRGADDSPVAITDLRKLYAESSAVEPWYRHGQLATDQESQDLAMKEEFCRPLAQTFQVSPEAMRIRLEQLELLVTTKVKSLF